MEERREVKLKKHVVTFTFEVTVYHDESLLPDAAWRKQYYSHIKTHADLASHLAYNLGIHESRLGMLDGFHGLSEDLSYVTDVDIVDEDVEELDCE
jgi:hypothetical protein